VKRRIAIAAAAAIFIALSVVVARWLQADNAERSRVHELLRAQARGDAGAMARAIDGCDSACAGDLSALARRLGRGSGDVEIVRYDSRTAHALGPETAPTRVVWAAKGGLPTVQCVLVRRTGTALSGPAVSLLRLSAPIGRQAGC
jgi:hypothetical protein